MPIHAHLAVAVRAKLARARTHAIGLAHTVRRSLTDGIVCGFRTIVAVLAALLPRFVRYDGEHGIARKKAEDDAWAAAARA